MISHTHYVVDDCLHTTGGPFPRAVLLTFDPLPRHAIHDTGIPQKPQKSCICNNSYQAWCLTWWPISESSISNLWPPPDMTYVTLAFLRKVICWRRIHNNCVLSIRHDVWPAHHWWPISESSISNLWPPPRYDLRDTHTSTTTACYSHQAWCLTWEMIV
jgi:hypothetical protein